MKANPEFVAALRAIEAEPWRADLVRDFSDYVARWGQVLNRRNPGDDFEPVVMTALYIAAGTFDPTRSDFRTWLTWKARTSVTSLYRKRERRRCLLPPGELASGLEDTGRTQESRDDQFLEMLSLISDRQQEAMIHLYCDDLSPAETARRMSIGFSRVVKLRDRALAKLREKLS